MFLQVPGYDLPDYQSDPDIAGDISISNGPLVWLSGRLDTEIVVPKGTPTNFASIPWFARSLIKVNGRHRAAAALHDYLYGVAGIISDNALFPPLTKKQCDLEMLDAMTALHVDKGVRLAMYAGLKIGGMFAWWKGKRSVKARHKQYLKDKKAGRI